MRGGDWLRGWLRRRRGGPGVGWGWLDVRSGREGAGLKTGHYMLNEFGARGRHGSVRRWGGLWGLGLWLGGLLGLGWWLGGLGLRLGGMLGLWGSGGQKGEATK